MHYFIDGYNMLFRLMQDAKDALQIQRDAIISDINRKAVLLNLDISLVFDSAFQIGGRTRGHFNYVEINYTAEGETADEYILDELKHSSHPQQETVVTSDRELARRARYLSAHTESIEAFVLRLNKAYKKRELRLKKVGSKPPPQPNIKARSAVQMPLSDISAPIINPPTINLPRDAPLEAYTEYYERVFESEWQEILAQDEIRRAESAKAATEGKPAPRKPRQKRDPFKAPPRVEPSSTNEMERWLKLFERWNEADEDNS